MKNSLIMLGISLVFMLNLVPAFSQPSEKKSITDSLETILSSKAQDDTSRISILIKLGKAYLFTDPRKTIDYTQQGIDQSVRQDINVDPMLYLWQGRGYSRIPDNDNAARLFNLAVRTATSQGDSVNLALIYNTIGWHYYNLREVPTALADFNHALSIGEALNDRVIQSEAWFGIGLSYYNYDDFESMYSGLVKYLALTDFTTQQNRIADAYRLIGVYYRDEGRIQDAIDANQQSYDIAESIGDSTQMGAALNHIAWYYYEMGNLEKSLQVYNKNIALYPPGQENYIANIYGNMGNIYRDWERYPEAIDYYNRSIELSLENNDLYNLSWLYEDISAMYERIGDYRQAYENMRLAAMYQDSLASVTYQQRMASARAQYEADKSAKELELLNVKLQRNRILVWGLAVGIGLIISVAILVITRSRFKTSQRIAEMNHTISELNQTNLRQQMNPHFIFNTLNSIQYYVFQNDKISSNNYMTKFASLIRKTLENSRHTAITIKEELDTLHLYLDLEALRFKEKFDWVIQVDEEIDTLLYKIPTMLIQPYVENAITHGLMNKENGKGYLKVDLQLQKDQILCTIEDNGIGRAKANEIKQQKNGTHQSMGLTITESRLKLVNELYGKSMTVSYTDLLDDAGEPAGTRVQINIPIIT